MSLPKAVRRPLVGAYNRWLSFRASRERSVKNVALRNDREAFETIYGSADLRAEYLGAERLAFYEEIAEFCAQLEPRRLIDIGCGTGHLLAAVLRLVPDLEVAVGIDSATAAVESVNQVAPRARAYVSSVYDLDLAGERFDLVLCTEVLEHLAHPDDALAVLASLCEAGGQIVVTVPDGERDDWEGHVNFWNAAELESFLAAAGSVVVTRTRSGDLLGVVKPV
jgi:2-polyprenyl-3-methyl-5-hydroxy-6-metoxy-1,4-benzoquinol methylase